MNSKLKIKVARQSKTGQMKTVLELGTSFWSWELGF